VHPLIETRPAAGARHLFPGLYAARVTSVDDPARLGRIKVSVPSVFGADAPELETWARPCWPHGHFFVPDVGNFVWVTFENADPAAPVWLGEWFPAGTEPPEAGARPPVKRVVRTASGNRILLDDTAGREQIVLEDATGNRIELRPDGVLLHAAADLTIEAPGKNIVIRASSVDVKSG
jgi:uncharacterized protein involved in type VI secretion and phage assembly